MRESQGDSAFLTPSIKITQVKNVIFALSMLFLHPPPPKKKRKQKQVDRFHLIGLTQQSSILRLELVQHSKQYHESSPLHLPVLFVWLLVHPHTSKIGTRLTIRVLYQCKYC